MIEANLYRSRIGIFQQYVKIRTFRVKSARKANFSKSVKISAVMIIIFIISILTLSSLPLQGTRAGSCEENEFEITCFQSLGKKQTCNFMARYLHGNIMRGVINMHINIRSLSNKMEEVKNLVKQEKPHILGISEAELKNRNISTNSLKLPGYDLILPKSWSKFGTARVVVYIKKSLEYEQLPDLEQDDLQTIWLRAGFKNSKKVYYSHQYREHTNTLGNSMAAQRTVLDKMLMQWEAALGYEVQDSANEVHIVGDMNLDCLDNRWQEASYPLVSLSRMVIQTCNSNNLSQMVDKVTRIQHNSKKGETLKSCIDHVYCNTKYRMSPVRVLPFGGSDHDAIIYTRYAKVPKPPPRTIKKRSYKDFKEEDYIRDVASIDFTDVYAATEVDDAANILTAKLVQVLDVHAPWILFQQRKNFVPWLTQDTMKMMKNRDLLKEKAKIMACNEGRGASVEQVEIWKQYKVLRNQVNNRIRQEEIKYKKNKMKDCQGDPSRVWCLAKKYMDWRTPGPPTQLEVESDNKVTLHSKAGDIAQIMNTFFISKVQNIIQKLRNLPPNLTGCQQVMKNRDLSISLKFVTVSKVRKLLGGLKNKTSSSVDMLDNYAVKLVADQVSGPLHHVITLSLMQQKFPTSWKFTKIIPLHKKGSQLKKENYRPVAILSPLSKVMEKIMYEQIYNYFSRNNLFHPSLHGYRKDRSTMTALLSMYDKWITAAHQGQVSGVVLVDLSAAFDLVSPSLLIQKLSIYGFKEDILNWITSYLTDRYQAVWINHVFSSFLLNSIGVPQGSNLGPLFFLIFFNDLPNFISEEIDCFADDSTLVAASKSIAVVGEKLTDDCNSLCTWMQHNRFKLNAEKTHLLTVGTSERLVTLTQNLEVSMDGVKLKETEGKVELLLGVKVQSNLKWSEQIESLSRRLRDRLNGLEKLRYIMGKNCRKNIVQGLFNSVLCYCLPLFGGCNSSDIQLLQTQQNRAGRIVLNLPPRFNRDTMFDMLGWMTVFQLVAYHTLLTIFRIRRSKEPEYLARALCRDNYSGNIIVENSRLGLYKKSFVQRGSTLWNSVPPDIRRIPSTAAFKAKLKKWVHESISMFC